jgi:RimJ/RimL family protein N-acetyltransferase
MENIIIRSFTDGDIDIMALWLSTPHVRKWYTEPEDWMHEIKNRNGEFKFVHHFITLSDGVPIGFCQYYDCYEAGEDWYSVSEKGKVFSIDYLIGETKYLGKGLGKATVLALEEEIRKNTTAKEVVVQPESDNAASNNTLRSCGYIFDKYKNYYHKNLSAQ